MRNMAGAALFGDYDVAIFSASPIVRATLNDLLPSEPLENVVSASKFRICDFSTTKCNEFNIMSVDVKNDEWFQLNEAILEVVENGDLYLRRQPHLKEIVLAPKPSDGRYHRAIVVKIAKNTKTKTPASPTAEVYFIDIGGYVPVAIDVLKPVNEEIMKFPILGYYVALDDLHNDSSKLLLRAEFQDLMKKLEKVEFTLKLGKKLSGAAAFTERTSVIMSYKTSIDTRDLATEIKQLKVWERERYSKGKGTDDDICENGTFGTKLRRFHDQAFISTYDFKEGAEFTAAVSRVTFETTRPNGESEALLRITLIDDAMYRNYFNVLHCQMQRYSMLITKSSYFPSIDEPVMFKLVEKPEYAEMGAKCMGRWCRAIRVDANVVYLIDIDNFVAFQNIPMEDYEMRRLYREFLKVPVLCISVYPKENGQYLPVAKAREIFCPKIPFTFKVTKARADGNYEAEFSKVVS